MIKEYCVTCTNDRLWNLDELIGFLVKNQQLPIVLTINPEAISIKELGLYKILDLFEFESVTIITANPFENHSRYNIICTGTFNFLQENVEIDPDLHQWNKNKIFLTMYHRPIASRLGIAGHLFTHHRDLSHLHFSYGTTCDNLTLYEMDKLLAYDLASAINASNMLPHLPLEIGSSHGYSHYGLMSNFESALREEYKNILIDVVGENHVVGETYFPTEKITRPIWLKKPFIVFASRDYLAYLRQLGFQTFQKFWNEEYDGFETRDRLLRIHKVIDDIAARSLTELADMYEEMKPILDHNYNLLQTQSYNTNLIKIS